jgi:hypothetical protein
MVQHQHKYLDRSRFPNITDPLESELKKKYDQMLIKMSKQLADKLKEMIL